MPLEVAACFGHPFPIPHSPSLIAGMSDLARAPCCEPFCLTTSHACIFHPNPQGYLASLGDPAVTSSLLQRFCEATNMTDEINALAALDRAGGRMPGRDQAAHGGLVMVGRVVGHALCSTLLSQAGNQACVRCAL